jgi:hypothetical protein
MARLSFISGLPRSGSTTLARILQQNLAFYAGIPWYRGHFPVDYRRPVGVLLPDTGIEMERAPNFAWRGSAE